MLCCLSSNQTELLEFDEHSGEIEGNESKPKLEQKLLKFDGHSSMIRSIAISSDKRAILTASSDAVKIWNRLVLCISACVNMR